jgi:hypothetical protein
MATSNTCDDCHVTTSWTNVRFDHNGVTGSCASCHNGTTATGKTPTHIQTAADCGDCHSTVAWTPARFDHASVSGSCGTCHNGSAATGRPANHFTTSLGCEDCHLTTAWTPIVFRHTSADYPGDHRTSVTCVMCHRNNAQTIAWPNAAYAPDCAACHANNYRSDPHTKYGNVRYTVSELRDCAGACHVYTDSSMTTIQTRRTSHHRTNSGGFD